MPTQANPPEQTPHGTSGTGTRLPAIARYWWLTALRGLVALALALAIAVAGRSTTRLVTFLALFWMTGGLITLRFAWPSAHALGSGWDWRRPARRLSVLGWAGAASRSSLRAGRP